MAQSRADLILPEKKKLIDKIEVFAGQGLYLPDDHGWAESTFRESDGRSVYKANPEKGYMYGLSLMHSINARFEIHGKFSFSKSKYSEDRAYLDVKGNVRVEAKSLQRNDYFVVSLVPTYFVSAKKRVYIFSGLSCSFLNHSVEYYAGWPGVNTIGGFNRQVVNVQGGVGYSYPINNRIEGSLRVQGEYGLSYTLHQHQESISVNGMSLLLAVRYLR